MMGNLNLALKTYSAAVEFVRSAGFEPEVEWQRETCFASFDETDFLRESAWVILCSGFREAIIRKKFSYLSLCFCDWESASAIVAAASACRDTALADFGNKRKIEAILQIARLIEIQGFCRLKERILSSPIKSLQELPHVGSVTSWHLAKNLGLDVAKPDRHLVRLSNDLGFQDVQHLCECVAAVTHHPKKVIDIVFWRYLAESYPRAQNLP